MKTGKKLLTGSLLALCAALLVLCIVLAAGWSKAAKTDTALPEVRNNGTAIQWKYSDEADWHDLVSLTELRGAAGEAGKDGANGKDGINGKSIEVQRAATHIQWRYAGDKWQNLVAIADITGPTGQKGADGANGKTPEFRVNESTLQWRYTGDEIWLNLYIFTARGMYRQPIFQTVQFPCTIGKCITAAGLYRAPKQLSG